MLAFRGLRARPRAGRKDTSCYIMMHCEHESSAAWRPTRATDSTQILQERRRTTDSTDSTRVEQDSTDRAQVDECYKMLPELKLTSAARGWEAACQHAPKRDEQECFKHCLSELSKKHPARRSIYCVRFAWFHIQLMKSVNKFMKQSAGHDFMCFRFHVQHFKRMPWKSWKVNETARWSRFHWRFHWLLMIVMTSDSFHETHEKSMKHYAVHVLNAFSWFQKHPMKMTWTVNETVCWSRFHWCFEYFKHSSWKSWKTHETAHQSHIMVMFSINFSWFQAHFMKILKS